MFDRSKKKRCRIAKKLWNEKKNGPIPPELLVTKIEVQELKSLDELNQSLLLGYQCQLMSEWSESPITIVSADRMDVGCYPIGGLMGFSRRLRTRNKSRSLGRP